MQNKIDVVIRKEIHQYKKYLHSELKKINVPAFFSHEMKISKQVNKEFENHFSKKHYDKLSAGCFEHIFEAWPVMSLLKQSMEIGYRLGKEKKKNDLLLKKGNIIFKKLDQFELNLKKQGESRYIPIWRLKFFFVTKDNRVHFAYTNIENTEKLETKELPEVFTTEDVQKALLKWENNLMSMMKKEKKWK